jgi:hypothetical protein
MTRTRSRPTRARRPLALIGAGTLCLATAAVPVLVPVAASAEEAPGSGLGSFNLSATAPVMQVRIEDGGYCGPGPTAGCEGVVPYAVSQLQSGPVGYGVSSIAWPGTLAGNFGSLLLVAGGDQVPPGATALNSPVRAEARTGQDPDTVTNTDYPGATMTATANATEVKAAGDVGHTTVMAAGGVGKLSGTTRTAVTGPSSAVAQSESRANDIALAGGQVKIESVVSIAEATTDAQTATVTGRTVVTGATIAGVPVSIDENGVRVQGQSAAVNAIATEAVNQVLGNLRLTLAVSQPVGTPDGSSVSYSAGSLVAVWEPEDGVAFTVMFGGSTVDVAAGEGFDLDLGDLGSFDDFTAPTDLGTTETFDSGEVSAGFGNPPELSGGSLGSPDVATAPPARTALASGELALPGGTGPLVVLLGLLGSGLIAAGLRRLPDRVLAATATICPLGEDR